MNFSRPRLAYERTHPAVIAGVFALGARDEICNLKRDPEQARDEVRVMTVHGAKGLQSPIVFLPDTLSHAA